MRRARLFIIIIMTFLCGNGFLFPQTGLAQTSPNPVIESTQNGLILTWTPSPYTLSDLDVDGQRYSRLQIPDLALSGRPGYPQLPFYSTMIGLPSTGGASLRLVEIETDVIQLPPSPLPAPVPQPIPGDVFNWLSGGPTIRIPDPALYPWSTARP